MREKDTTVSVTRTKKKVLRLKKEDRSQVVAQSPIALFSWEAINWTPKKPLIFTGHWDATEGQALIVNNGATAYLTLIDKKEPPFLSGGPLKDVYVFEQLHFHWSQKGQHGSEHLIDGNKYDAEAHLVHYNKKYGSFQDALNKKDGLAVVGFFLNVTSSENEFFSPISTAVAEIPKVNQEATLKSDCFRWMLTTTLSEYFTYRGSLTTEPFHESVTWILYTDPIDVSVEQLEPFRNMEIYIKDKLVTCNARNIQNKPEGLCVRCIKTRNDWKGFYQFQKT